MNDLIAKTAAPQLPPLTRAETITRLEGLATAREGAARAYAGGDRDVIAGLRETAHTYREAIRLLKGE